MAVGPPLGPHLEPAVLVDGGEGPLDRVPRSPQPAPVGHPGACEPEAEAQPPQHPLVPGRAVRPVAGWRPGGTGRATRTPAAGTPPRSAAGPSRRGRWRWSRWRPGAPRRRPPSGGAWCRLSRGPSGWDRWRPQNGPHTRRVDGRPLPIDPPGPVQPLQQHGMDAGSGAVGLPGGQPPPARHARPVPLSAGRFSQARPVLRTNRMPVRVCRWARGGRPPFGRGGWGGRAGAMTAHRAAGRIGRATAVPPRVSRHDRHRTAPRPGFVRVSDRVS